MNEFQRVVIIGGGIAGLSLLYWLTRRGWSDVLLVERFELTDGSTWHAAGNVTHFGHLTSITRLYADSIATYLAAETESTIPIDFHRTGSLRLAYTEEELAVYRRLTGIYARLGLRFRVIDSNEIERLHPLLERHSPTHEIAGAAHTPDDGHLDPNGACRALAAAARARGARIREHCRVADLRRHRGEWEVDCGNSRIRAEHVVVANSFWSRELLAPMGLDLPVYPLEHQEIVTGPVPEIERLEFELPTVRDPKVPANTRQEGSGFLCGIYERQPRPWGVEGIPRTFGRQLLPVDLDRLQPHFPRLFDRIPSFGRAGIRTVNNGPIAYTPDGCPLVGPVPATEGLWLATGFCVGIGTGGGAARYLSHWMTEGDPEFDLPFVYPSRFSDPLSRDACLARIREVYRQGYVLPEIGSRSSS